jgi:hypothetical protein
VTVAAFVISLLALLIAGWSLWYTHRADRRAEAAEERSEQADRREVEARLEVTALGGRRPGDGSTEYIYRILNAGKVAAHEVRAWLVDENGEQMHEDAAGPGLTLLPLEASEVEIRTRAEVDDLLLAIYWSDGAGDHIETRDSRGRRLSPRPPDVRRPDAR